MGPGTPIEDSFASTRRRRHSRSLRQLARAGGANGYGPAMARIRFAAGVLLGAAALRLATANGLVNYDTLYTLVWGRELAHGDAARPRGRDRADAASARDARRASLLSPLSSLEIDGLHGELAAAAVIGLAYVSLALLGWVVFALGREWFNAAAGVIAAAIVLTRVPVLDFGARAYVDIPYLVLVLAALLVETRRPRAGPPVLVLLALAGLLRPEAWLFSFAYVAWLLCAGRALGARRGGREPARRVRDAAPLLALAASGPLLWCLHDLLLTGDPLHSLTGTRDNAALLGRVTGLDNVPSALPRRIGEILREPVLLAAAGGGVLALAWHRDRRTRLGACGGRAGDRGVLRAGGGGAADHHPLRAARRNAAGDLRRRRRVRLDGPAAGLAAHVVGALRRARAARAAALRPQPGAAHRAPRRRAQPPGADPGRPRRCRAATACRAGRWRCPTAARSRCWRCGSSSTRRAIVDAQAGVPQRGTYLVPRTPKVAGDYILDRRDRDRAVAPPPPGFERRRQNASWVEAAPLLNARAASLPVPLARTLARPAAEAAGGARRSGPCTLNRDAFLGRWRLRWLRLGCSRCAWR